MAIQTYQLARELAEKTISEYKDSKIEVLANQLDSIQQLLDSIEKEIWDKTPDQDISACMQKKAEARQEYEFISLSCEDLGVAKVVEQFRDAKAYLISIDL